ncbi:S8 family peptidase [Flavobacterium sp. IB48]|uniref:S8 family peptidase n=1 Tax=Flavobacterium sp. IB48 TaxID=2779375 RepID=UPI0018E84EBD|nr:S8 family peptidase [Flavobacterium sp. IB48]MBJ2126592.1 S8 family peptidase [Flavobacterium sp. IB48]
MSKRNFLLGKGERLTEPVIVPSGGGAKESPYTFYEAKERLQPMLDNLADKVRSLPDDICPGGLTVATITLNPEYIAKSYHPTELLRSVGLTSIGSRKRTITPEKKSKNREPLSASTTELFVVGQKATFIRWANQFNTWDQTMPGANQIVEIEQINFLDSEDKLKSITSDKNESVFEIVLHGVEDHLENAYLIAFKKYLHSLGVEASFDKRFFAGKLIFVELKAPSSLANDIAKFSLVRVVRTMPSLRLLKPIFRSSGISSGKVLYHDLTPLDSNIKTAIFDGGIPDDHPICKWATPYDTSGCGPSAPELEEHGVSVTSAFLFGHIIPGKVLPRPYSYVDHYRVLDNLPGQNPYELYDVLDRIIDVLSTSEYDFVNLSLGPSLPIDDDEVHAWTAVLDEFLSKGSILATVAVGNDGEGDPTINANRVQVPSDCVNALAIGACDTPDQFWERASYSSIGPGRSPGLIKPDLVDFGGSVGRPFLVTDLDGINLLQTGGTSFAAPSTLRLASGIKAHFGGSLNALAIRTLLIHSSESSELPKFEVGWGRVARDLEGIVICEDHVMRVVYQGRISAAKYLRAPIPLPPGPISGMVKIKATLCYATPVDPHCPDNYTRSGLEPFFRPNKNRKRKVEEGEAEPMHALTKPFFAKARKGFETEEDLRIDAFKWENCMHYEGRFQGSSLDEPLFDIHYNARAEGHNDTRVQELDYALVVTVEAPKVKDLYDQVVRRYATQLEQLQPIIDIPIRT